MTNSNNIFKYLEKYINLLNNSVKERIGTVLPYDPKINEEADALRSEGNKAFKYKHYVRALELYSKSLAHAEPNSKSMAYAYGNRSAVFFEKGFYNECLEDIHRALANNYPEESIDKLKSRQQKAEEMKHKQEANVLHDTIPEIPVQYRNKLIQCAANNVKITRNEAMGRCIVADRNIEMGEIIAVESPFATTVTCQRYLNCHECMCPNFNMIPCPGCTIVMYCNEKCKNFAWKKYHKYECRILCTLYNLLEEIGVSLKIALSIRDYNEFHKVKTSQEAIYRSDRYVEILDLCTNCDKRSREYVERLGFIAISVFQSVERYTDFFEDLHFPKAEDIFKGIILKLLFISPTNFHRLTTLVRDNELLEDEEQTGGGAYPFLSLLNHSCDPNVFVTRYGTTKVVRARRNIKVNEQLFDNYGQSFQTHPFQSRQLFLRESFFFDCHCTPCKNRWPILDKLPCFSPVAQNLILDLSEMISNNEDNIPFLREILEQLVSMVNLHWVVPSSEWQLFQETFDECCLSLANKTITL